MKQDVTIGRQTIINEYLSAGNAALEAGNHERAVELFTQLIKQLPDEALGYAAMASVQTAMGQVQDAVVSLRYAVELMPEEAGMQHHLGVALLQMGNEKEAEMAFREVLSIEPRYTDAYLNLVELYLKQSRHGDAVEILEQAVQRFPENGDVFAAFVKFKLAVDGAEGGRPALEQLRTIDPEHPDIPSFEDTIRELEEPNS